MQDSSKMPAETVIVGESVASWSREEIDVAASLLIIADKIFRSLWYGK